MLLIGSPGGASIIPFVAQALVGILDFGQDPQTAIDAPHVLNRNATTQVEDGPEAEATIAALATLGDVAEAADLNSGLQAILIGDGGLDRRRRQAPRRAGHGPIDRAETGPGGTPAGSGRRRTCTLNSTGLSPRKPCRLSGPEQDHRSCAGSCFRRAACVRTVSSLGRYSRHQGERGGAELPSW